MINKFLTWWKNRKSHYEEEKTYDEKVHRHCRQDIVDKAKELKETKDFKATKK